MYCWCWWVIAVFNSPAGRLDDDGQNNNEGTNHGQEDTHHTKADVKHESLSCASAS